MDAKTRCKGLTKNHHIDSNDAFRIWGAYVGKSKLSTVLGIVMFLRLQPLTPSEKPPQVDTSTTSTTSTSTSTSLGELGETTEKPKPTKPPQPYPYNNRRNRRQNRRDRRQNRRDRREYHWSSYPGRFEGRRRCLGFRMVFFFVFVWRGQKRISNFNLICFFLTVFCHTFFQFFGVYVGLKPSFWAFFFPRSWFLCNTGILPLRGSTNSISGSVWKPW